jgi:hypothetical protein
MRKMNVMRIMLLGFIVLGIGFLSSCKKSEGCTDLNANNYDPEADENCCCAYPTINVTSSGTGDVTGAGGTASKTWFITNSTANMEYAMDITAANGGSFQLIVNDADGKEVVNKTLTVGVGDDSLSGCYAPGTAGEWTVTIRLTNFSGDGSYTLDPAGAGC